MNLIKQILNFLIGAKFREARRQLRGIAGAPYLEKLSPSGLRRNALHFLTLHGLLWTLFYAVLTTGVGLPSEAPKPPTKAFDPSSVLPDAEQNQEVLDA